MNNIMDLETDEKMIDEIDLNNKLKLLDLLKEISLFASFLGILLLILYITCKRYLYLVDILLYPVIFCYFIFWLKIFKKDNLKKYLLNRPILPKGIEKYLYLLYTLGFIVIFIIWIFLLTTELGAMNTTTPDALLVEFFRMCVCAPIVEEIIFRGYLYHQSEKIWGQDRWYIKKNKIKHDPKVINSYSEKLISLEITSAAIFSSIFFSLWHLDIIKLAHTFLSGLILCKVRNNSGKSLVIPIFLHFTINFYLYLGIYTNSSFVEEIFYSFASFFGFT